MPPLVLKPFWQTSDNRSVKLYLGDVLPTLKRLPAKSVHMCVTSPPYWGLRDYGVEGQLGSEKTPEDFVQNMVQLFREVRRVLRDDGTLWLNLGDTYSGGGGLVGIPWRVALALQADGWILRQDIIWHKPSPMPESVRNRCTKAHEYLFLLAKSKSYYYDAEAIREEAEYGRRSAFRSTSYENNRSHMNGSVKAEPVTVQGSNPETGRNKRDVWSVDDPEELLYFLRSNHPQLFEQVTSVIKTSDFNPDVWKVSSEAYPGAHFATFPKKLIEPAILAGTSEKGCCANCGAPWIRITEEEKLKRDRPNDYVKRTGAKGTGNSAPNSAAGVRVTTKGWEPSCKCEASTVPCIVLDPFIGSGTTCCVSLANGRDSIGIDISETYLRNNAIPRIEGEILNRPGLSHLLTKKPVKLGLGRKL